MAGAGSVDPDAHDAVAARVPEPFRGGGPVRCRLVGFTVAAAPHVTRSRRLGCQRRQIRQRGGDIFACGRLRHETDTELELLDGEATGRRMAGEKPEQPLAV